MRRPTLQSRHDLLLPFSLTRRGLLRPLVASSGLALAGHSLWPAASAYAQAAEVEKVPDWDVPGGHFYTQGAPTDAPADSGFVLADAGDVPFWREYRAMGGPAQLGFPVSSRYAEGPNAYQVLQAGMLRWSGAVGVVDLHPIFHALSELGLDDWLVGQGIPRPAPALLQDPNLSTASRMAWLTQPQLQAAYMTSDAETAWRRFGLPMGEPERFGPYLAQRFERAVLQLWLDAVPGQPAPGSVTIVQIGTLLEAAGLIPAEARVPATAPAPRPVVQTPRPTTLPVVDAPGAPGNGRQVVVSLARQWWWAYDNREVANNGPVTTGQPELATPTGRFTIFSRFSPYTMYSPWPPSSKYYYTPSSMTYAMQITGNGVFLHDAPWRPFYGPGTNVPHYDPDGVWRTGSHGCINMPFQAAAWLWNFAPNGTPVLVI